MIQPEEKRPGPCAVGDVPLGFSSNGRGQMPWCRTRESVPSWSRASRTSERWQARAMRACLARGAWATSMSAAGCSTVSNPSCPAGRPPESRPRASTDRPWTCRARPRSSTSRWRGFPPWPTRRRRASSAGGITDLLDRNARLAVRLQDALAAEGSACRPFPDQHRSTIVSVPASDTEAVMARFRQANQRGGVGRCRQDPAGGTFL
jgi:hypothetical protein